MVKAIWLTATLAGAYLAIATPLYFYGHSYSRLYDMEFTEIEAWVGPPIITSMILNSVYFQPDQGDPKLRIVARYPQEETDKLTSNKIEELRKLGRPNHVYKFRILEEPAFIICPIPKSQTYFSSFIDFLSAPISCRYHSEPMS